MNQLSSATIAVTLVTLLLLGYGSQMSMGRGLLPNGAIELASASGSTNQQQTRPSGEGDQPVDDHGQREIRATNRISIPYGFAATLPLGTDGQSVQAIGHGGCTENEEVTVAVTVTQSTTGALATGQWQGTCTGELQHWTVDAAIVSGGPFEAGAAGVCGIATTRSDGEVTDTDEWCPEEGVTLIWRAYVPAILSRPEQ